MRNKASECTLFTSGKLIYTPRVTFNALFLWHLYSVLEVIFYLRHFKLNFLHYITLQK